MIREHGLNQEGFKFIIKSGLFSKKIFNSKEYGLHIIENLFEIKSNKVFREDEVFLIQNGIYNEIRKYKNIYYIFGLDKNFSSLQMKFGNCNCLMTDVKDEINIKILNFLIKAEDFEDFFIGGSNNVFSFPILGNEILEKSVGMFPFLDVAFYQNGGEFILSVKNDLFKKINFKNFLICE